MDIVGFHNDISHRGLSSLHPRMMEVYNRSWLFSKKFKEAFK